MGTAETTATQKQDRQTEIREAVSATSQVDWTQFAIVACCWAYFPLLWPVSAQERREPASEVATRV